MHGKKIVAFSVFNCFALHLPPALGNSRVKIIYHPKANNGPTQKKDNGFWNGVLPSVAMRLQVIKPFLCEVLTKNRSYHGFLYAGKKVAKPFNVVWIKKAIVLYNHDASTPIVIETCKRIS